MEPIIGSWFRIVSYPGSDGEKVFCIDMNKSSDLQKPEWVRIVDGLRHEILAAQIVQSVILGCLLKAANQGAMLEQLMASLPTSGKTQ